MALFRRRRRLQTVPFPLWRFAIAVFAWVCLGLFFLPERVVDVRLIGVARRDEFFRLAAAKLELLLLTLLLRDRLDLLRGVVAFGDGGKRQGAAG